MQTIGWRHAEPVVRSLAYALLEHEDGNPAHRDGDPDRPWRENIKRAQKIRADWKEGKVSAEASADLLAAMRSAGPADACEKVVELLNSGVGPDSVWDGLFLTAGELLMRQPGIVGVHCVTSQTPSISAIKPAATTKRVGCSCCKPPPSCQCFESSWRVEGSFATGYGWTHWEKLEPNGAGSQALEEIFADVSKDRLVAARKTLALLERPDSDPQALMAIARRLVFNKGNDSHDYKFSSAALEDYYHATPAWRNRYLAMSMFHLRGALDRDNQLVKQTRGALA